MCRRYACLFCLLFFLFASPLAAAGPRPLTLSLPAETVLLVLRGALPFSLPVHDRQIEGNITVESLQELSIKNNIVSVQGVLSGRDMAMNAKIAGQDMRLKFSQVRLPVRCNLQLRFDAASRQLFVRPSFPGTGNTAGNGQEASLAPLFESAGGKEYPVDLTGLQRLRPSINGQAIPLSLEPAGVTGIDNTLVLSLLPRAGGN